jgi:PKHD-type hydroxylase
VRFLIEPLLQPAAVAELKGSLSSGQACWEPGALTAGRQARASKNNWQLDRATPLFEQLQLQVVEAMLEHPLLRSAALPLRLHSVLFSRSQAGEGYGRHVDNAFMGGGRTDLSFTLFLSEPHEYEGGELTSGGRDQQRQLRKARGGSRCCSPVGLVHTDAERRHPRLQRPMSARAAALSPDPPSPGS